MQIPQSVIEQLNEKADLVGIIKRHTALKPNGREFKGCCPFHGEKTPSFFVNPDTNLYYCFGCGAKGNAISFLVDYEKMSFLEALQTLSERTGIDLPKEDNKKYQYNRTKTTPAQSPTAKLAQPIPIPPPAPNFFNPNFPANNGQPLGQPVPTAPTQTPPPPTGQSIGHPLPNPFTPNAPPNWQPPVHPQPPPPTQVSFANDLDGDLFGLLTAVNRYYQAMLKDTPTAYRYLANRGLSGETISHFELGYAPSDWQHLQKAFPNDVEGLRMLGLIRTSQKGKEFDLFRDRVMFPIKDKQGRVVGFAGRALDDDTLPKYINSSDSVVFQKNHILYGYYESRQQKAKDWLVVEGYLDVISLFQAGIYGAVAPMGTAINEGQIGQLLKFNDELTLCFDGDDAGQRASLRALEVAMPVLADGKSLKFLTLPDNHDPDTYTKTHGKEKMQSAIDNALPLSDYLHWIMANRYDLSRPEQKASAMRDVKALTDKLPKGASLRSWLNSDFFTRLKGKPSKKTQPANYQATQPTLDEQLALCLLYEPTLAQHIGFDWHNINPDDPLMCLYADSNLLNSHLPFEFKLSEHNLITPALPSWASFCQIATPETPHATRLNWFGELILLIKSALPSLIIAQNHSSQSPTVIQANALFLLGAMGKSPTQSRLASQWQTFFELLQKNPQPNSNRLLFNELLCRAVVLHIKQAQAQALHLLISQLHHKRLSLLDAWLKHHSFILDQHQTL